MENSESKVVSLRNFKTKASDESHTTFISANKNATSTPLSYSSLGKKEISVIDFTTILLYLDINKTDATTVTLTKNILFSTPNCIKNFPIPKSSP